MKMSVYLVNTFEVFEGREAEFLDLWQQTGALFRASDGFISAELLKSMPPTLKELAPTYSHINFARWQSEDAYLRALQNKTIRKLGPAYAEVCTFRPALYDVQIVF